MRPSFLLIVRNWHGHGGMQRFARDLWGEIERSEGSDAMLCVPRDRSLLALAVFVLQSVHHARTVLKAGGHVHLMDPSLCILLPFLGGHADRISVSAHGLDVLYPNPMYQWMIRRFLPRVSRVLAISRATADAAEARGVDPAKIVVLPCGIPFVFAKAQLSTLPPPSPHLVTVARLVERKGIAWFLLEVFPILQSEYPTMTYHIIGTGPALKLIKKIVQEKSLQKAVFIHTDLDDAARDALVAGADLCVMPNISVAGDMEGFGIACIEASARGVPVVAARIEGLVDAVIDGQTGIFFESGDACDCIRRIRQCLHAPLDRERVARVTRERFHWSVLFPRYRDVLF